MKKRVCHYFVDYVLVKDRCEVYYHMETFEGVAQEGFPYDNTHFTEVSLTDLKTFNRKLLCFSWAICLKSRSLFLGIILVLLDCAFIVTGTKG